MDLTAIACASDDEGHKMSEGELSELLWAQSHTVLMLDGRLTRAVLVRLGDFEMLAAPSVDAALGLLAELGQKAG